MSKVSINETTLTNIGAAIRAKTGKTDLIAPGDMPAEIQAIETGGGGMPNPLVVNDIDAVMIGSSKAWDWVWQTPGQVLKLECASTSENRGSSLFLNSTCADLSSLTIITEGNTGITQSAFEGAMYLTTLPKWYPLTPISSNYRYQNMFSNCKRLKSIPKDWFKCKDEQGNLTGEWARGDSNMFPCYYYFAQACFSLRQVPDFYPTFNCNSSTSYSAMGSAFANCYCLDEVHGLPVPGADKTTTANQYGYSFYACSRLKSLTFVMNDDGTPRVCNMNGQRVDLTDYIGYAIKAADITGWSSGLTTATQVTDADTYAALKDNPDYWTLLPEYSRYNHDSAVETINSLPDCSAYIAGTSAANYLMLKGAQGNGTDGGAINTLTEEEIAVAAAKGWTVTFE